MSVEPSFLQFADLRPEALLLVTGSGTVLAANRAVLRLGLSPGSLAGQPLADFTTTPAGALADYLRTCSRSRQMLPGSLTLKRPDGQSLSCRAEGAVLQPRGESSEAILLLALVPREAGVNRFMALNERIEQLGREVRRRRRAEDALREQQQWLETTLLSIGDAVIATDTRGRVRLLNPLAESLTGWPREEATDRPVEEVFRIINEQTRAPVESPVARVIREGTVVGLANHTVLISRDGVERPIDDTGAPIHDAGGDLLGVVLVFRDVSLRRQAERRLGTQYAVTRLLAESSTPAEALPHILQTLAEGLGWDMGAFWEVEAQAGVLRCVEVWPGSSAAERMAFVAASRQLVLPPGVGLPGRVWTGEEPAWVADIAGDSNFPRGRQAARAGLHGACAFPVRLGQQTLGVLEFFSAAVRPPDDDLLEMMAAVGSQVGQFLERKRAEQAVRRSEVRKAAILETALDAIITIDHQGNVVELNPAAERLFGYTRAEVVGREMAELFVPAPLRDQHRRGLAHCVATGEGPLLGRRVEVVGLRADGSEFPAELAITRILNAGPPLFTGHVRDISAARRAEQERTELLERERAAREEAEAASRTKDEFLATLSHELRTPLNAMLGWVHLLRSGKLDQATAQRGLEVLERNTRAQTRLINDLLDVSRMITGKLQLVTHPVDLVPVVEAALDAVRPAAEAKGVHIESRLDPLAGPVQGDPTRLQQVVWNLLSNAVKFTPGGGKVEVRLEQAGPQVRLLVADTGQGVSTAFLPHMFERFRQADSSSTRAHGGLGLGLALVRHLVELHGGTVGVESPGEGQGATFTVQLPLASVPAGPALAGPEETLGFPLALDGVRILVAEDDPDTRDLLGNLFGECGAETTRAASAEEALRVLQTERFDVLVSDIGMPGQDGYTLIRAVRAREAEVGGWLPAVALTAYTRPDDRARALAAGYQVHVPKPVEPGELAAVVADLTGRARRLRGAPRRGGTGRPEEVPPRTSGG